MTTFFLLLSLFRPFVLLAEQKALPTHSQLRSFYILAHVFSDAAPFWFEYVLDVRPQEGRTLVLYIRVARPHPSCGGVIIKAAERTVQLSPLQLLGPADPCSLDIRRLNGILRSARIKSPSLTDTVGFDIVAKCGSSKPLGH